MIIRFDYLIDLLEGFSLSHWSRTSVRISTVIVNHRVGLCLPCWGNQQSIFLPWFSSIPRGINDANFASKIPLFFLLQTLTNAILQTSVTRMLRVTTPKDLTTALVMEDLKATGELTARVRFCWGAYLIVKVRMKRFLLQRRSFQQHLNSPVWLHKNFQFHRLIHCQSFQSQIFFVCWLSWSQSSIH